MNKQVYAIGIVGANDYMLGKISGWKDIICYGESFQERCFARSVTELERDGETQEMSLMYAETTEDKFETLCKHICDAYSKVKGFELIIIGNITE